MSEYKTQQLIVEGIAPSLNVAKRSTKWSRKASTLETSWYWKVKLAAREQGIETVQNYPVTVRCECYFGPGDTRFDADNTVTTSKLIQDGLVNCGVLHNDSPKYVAEVSLAPLRTKDPSYTKFIITEEIK